MCVCVCVCVCVLCVCVCVCVSVFACAEQNISPNNGACGDFTSLFICLCTCTRGNAAQCKDRVYSMWLARESLRKFGQQVFISSPCTLKWGLFTSLTLVLVERAPCVCMCAHAHRMQDKLSKEAWGRRPRHLLQHALQVVKAFGHLQLIGVKLVL